MKLLIAYCFLSLSIVYGNDEDLRRIDAIFDEQDCRSAGGTCTIATDCPDGGLTEEKGLCPQQQQDGIECCYGLSTKETRCKKRGGECMPKGNTCSHRLTFERASDCSPNGKCCILV